MGVDLERILDDLFGHSHEAEIVKRAVLESKGNYAVANAKILESIKEILRLWGSAEFIEAMGWLNDE
jgi:hypothetical protein